MKKTLFLLLSVGVLAVLIGCPNLVGGAGAGSGGASSPRLLPADQVSDELRSAVGVFTFETLLPVELELTVDLFGVDDDGELLDQPLPFDSATVVARLATRSGTQVYSGMVSAEGVLRATVYLPSAPADMVLTLTSEGFDSRTVTIPRMVAHERIVRRMSMRRSQGSVGAASFTPGLADRDGDGVPDVYDAFPDDPDAAFILNVPAEGHLTIAFEDLFGRARAGDADYNDFIAEYTIQEISNAEGFVTSLRVDANAKVKLAGYNHRFGIRIDEFEGSADLVREYVDVWGIRRSQTVRNVTAPMEIELFEHSGRAVGTSAWFTLHFATAQRQPQSPSPLSEPPYNPWIIVRNTGNDIHLIDREPLTELIVSRNPNDRFVDDDGFPWALLVPKDWEHPAEAQRIDSDQWYPRFTDWRLSGGLDHTDWYNFKGDPYEPPKTDPAVYAAGYYFDGTRDVAAYWKEDGNDIQRFDLQTDGRSEALDIVIDASGNVLAAGYIRSGATNTAVYWRNGERIDLQSGGQATGIVVSDDGSVYVSGYFRDEGRDVAAYWVDRVDSVNPTSVSLHTDSNARGTGIDLDSAGVVYVSGYYDNGVHNVAAYWRHANDTVSVEALFADGLSEAYSVSVDGTGVYVAGRYLDSAVYAAIWKDNAENPTIIGEDVLIRSIVRADSETYAAGDYQGNAAFWRGTTRTDLVGSGSSTSASAYGLHLFGTDIYVAGVQTVGTEQAVYWKNGQVQELSPDTRSRVYAIAFK